MAQFNSGYSSSEILSMQRDAAKRVKEMQRKAADKLNNTLKEEKGNTKINPPTDLKSINLDRDKLILICLFLLLLNEEADSLLLLALAYIFF